MNIIDHELKSNERFIIVYHQLHRRWWRMLETKYVGDNFKMLVSVLAILVTNILCLSMSGTSKRCHQDLNSVANILKCHQRHNVTIMTVALLWQKPYQTFWSIHIIFLMCFEIKKIENFHGDFFTFGSEFYFRVIREALI